MTSHVVALMSCGENESDGTLPLSSPRCFLLLLSAEVSGAIFDNEMCYNDMCFRCAAPAGMFNEDFSSEDELFGAPAASGALFGAPAGEGGLFAGVAPPAVLINHPCRMEYQPSA